jgi:hypothetical protein
MLDDSIVFFWWGAPILLVGAVVFFIFIFRLVVEKLLLKRNPSKFVFTEKWPHSVTVRFWSGGAVGFLTGLIHIYGPKPPDVGWAGTIVFPFFYLISGSLGAVVGATLCGALAAIHFRSKDAPNREGHFSVLRIILFAGVACWLLGHQLAKQVFMKELSSGKVGFNTWLFITLITSFIGGLPYIRINRTLSIFLAVLMGVLAIESVGLRYFLR